MMSRVYWLLGAGIVVLGLGAAGASYLNRAVPAPPPPPPSMATMRRPAPKPAFTDAELRPFLKAAREAEAIDDPLKRCLAYPEPPGVHWSPAVTSAYCHYVLDPAVTPADVRELIENGRVAELERRLADARQAQFSQPGMQNLLDRTYNFDFSDSKEDMRPLVDAWKRQAPDSPYALAASGTVYVALAWKQRGGKYVSETPRESLEAMSRLLDEARTDLDRAVTLDPKMTPAYNAMFHAAALEGDDAYAASAGRRALSVDPASFPVYARLVWMSQPKWGGSVPQMQRIISQAQTHAKENPLLRLLLSERTGGDAVADDVSCAEAAQWDLYRQAFDEAAILRMLTRAAWAASHCRSLALSVVYSSEVLRFDPANLNHRQSRAFDLAQTGEGEWALAEGNALVKLAPRDGTSFDARAQAYLALDKVSAAAADFEQALRIDPTDAWTLRAVGYLYVNNTHEWDKAWDVANRLLQAHPDDPQGWVLRAIVQKEQPREGIDQTIADFKARFGNDPDKLMWVGRLESIKAQH